MNRILITLVVSLGILGTAEAQKSGGKPGIKGAMTLTWCFSGQFEQFPTEYRDLGLAVGDLFVGGMQIESNSTDTTANDLSRGTYLPLRGFIYIPSIAIYSEFSYPSNGLSVTIINGNSDFFETYFRTTPISATEVPLEVFFFNGPLPVTTFTSDSLPSLPPAIQQFEYTRFQYTNYSISSGASATGSMNSLLGLSKRTSDLRRACGA